MKPQSASEQKNSIRDIRAPVRNVKRGRGRPRRGDEKNPISVSRSKRSWSRLTRDYVKMITKGKGAPCRIWSMKEKKRLLQALQKHSHQDWDSLCKMVPSRTKQEIQEYIHTLRGGDQCKSKPKDEIQLTWAPIESWLDMSSEMVHYEQTNLSNVLSRVFSCIGHFGDFPQADDTASELVPDYGKLYRYIAAIMDESLSMPDLSPLESAIIADLMHGLGDLLRMSDTSLQRKVMCWKYKMLNYKFEFDDVRSSLDRIRKALTNDFSDLQRDNRTVSGLPSFSQASSSAADETTTPSAVSAMSSPFISATQSSSAPSGGEASSVTPSHPGQTSGEASPSRCLKMEPEPCASSDGHQPQQVEDTTEDKPKRGRGRPRIYDWRRPIEKPRLFTMNPFCVPIRLLRLKPLLGGETAPRNASAPAMLRRQPAPVSPSPSDASDNPSCRRGSIEAESSQAELTNSIRQVTGLYVPKVVRKNRKRALPVQASANTMRAIAEALAKRSKEKEAARPLQPAADPNVVKVINKGNSSATTPSQAFRCVPLPDGKMALVPLHLRDAATLSQVQMKEAVPVPKRMPGLKACPAVERSRSPDLYAAGGSSAMSVHAPGTSGARPVSTPGLVACSGQSTISAHIQGVALQVDTSQKASHPLSRELTVAQLHSSTLHQNRVRSPSRVEEIVQLTLAPSSLRNPAQSATNVAVQQKKSALGSKEQKYDAHQPQYAQSVWAPSRKRPHSPQPVSEATPAHHGVADDSEVKVPMFAQIIPRKRRPYAKQAQPLPTTTEIVVLPPKASKMGNMQVTSGTSKTGPPPTKQRKRTKSPRKKAAKDPGPEKKARSSKPRQSKAGRKSTKTAPPLDAQTVVSSDTPNSSQLEAGTTSSCTCADRKASDTNDSEASVSDLSPHHPEASGPLENGVPLTSSLSSRPEVNFSGPLIPHSAVTEPNSFQVTAAHQAEKIGDSIQKSLPPKHVSQTLTENSHQTQPCSAVPAVGQATPEHSRQGKPSFRTILAQVASDTRICSASGTPSSARSVVSDRSSESGPTVSPHAKPTPGHSGQPRPSASLSAPAQRSPSKRIKLTKNFLSIKDPKSTPQSPTSLRGRKKKTDEPDEDIPSKSSKTDKMVKSAAASKNIRKQVSGGAVASDMSAGKNVKKRPHNFLASQDISNMIVEVVTPQDTKQRLLASMGKGPDSTTHRPKKVAEAQKLCGGDALNVVLDDDEISLVSI
ncbi:uncharacterized protein LOC143289270 [Babylonia areolata]|uniref:uncharacterized protein LOC143289270 n=1 Tax=Babylonia areolata TaxID=304850 RepID=UPI003FCF4C0B